MKKRFLIPALIALSSTSALAGYKLTANVVVQANGIAYGSMGSARNSADTMQFIGCEIYATTSYSNLSCRARSSAGLGTAGRSTDRSPPTCSPRWAGGSASARRG